MTFPRIHATPRCAARSSARLDLLPARLLACAWAAWILVVCGVLLFGVEIPLPARLGLCAALLAGNASWISSAFLRRGTRAIRTLAWSGRGLSAGTAGEAPETAALLRGSCRLGTGVLYLRVRLRDRCHTTIIDGGVQEAAAFRALCARLPALLRAQPGPGSHAN